MHTFQAPYWKPRWYLHHNGDFSGDVIITDDETKQTLTIPAVHLLEFVASYVRGEKVARLENMNAKEILLG